MNFKKISPGPYTTNRGSEYANPWGWIGRNALNNTIHYRGSRVRLTPYASAMAKATAAKIQTVKNIALPVVIAKTSDIVNNAIEPHRSRPSIDLDQILTDCLDLFPIGPSADYPQAVKNCPALMTPFRGRLRLKSYALFEGAGRDRGGQYAQCLDWHRCRVGYRRGVGRVRHCASTESLIAGNRC